MSVSLLETARPIVYQTAFWPPDRELCMLTKRRPRALLQLLTFGATVIPITAAVQTAGAYPCTYPGCHRGLSDPFPNAPQLANHRFAAHGIRSTNEQSIKRQQRRDKARALEKGNAPEYIDHGRIRAEIEKRFPINLPQDTRAGDLDAGDREHVRRRLCYLITLELRRELRRAPAELCIAIAEIAATALEPAGLQKSVRLRAIDAMTPGPASRKTAIART